MSPVNASVAKALSNERRVEILTWLKDPRAHFPKQVAADLVRDGVCSIFIAQKLRVSQPTASVHLRILAEAGLVTSKRIRPWIFYKRNEQQIAKVKKAFASDW